MLLSLIPCQVVPHKLEMITDYFNKLLSRWPGVKLLGVIPDEPYLGRPTLMDLENIFKFVPRCLVKLLYLESS